MIYIPFKERFILSLKKVINFSIIRNNKQQRKLKNVRNAPQLYPIINNDMINFQKSGKANNSYLEESNKIQINKDDMQRSLNNNMKKFILLLRIKETPIILIFNFFKYSLYKRNFQIKKILKILKRV